MTTTVQRQHIAYLIDPTLTLPSDTPRGKPHGIRLSVEVPKAVCI